MKGDLHRTQGDWVSFLIRVTWAGNAAPARTAPLTTMTPSAPATTRGALAVKLQLARPPNQRKLPRLQLNSSSREISSAPNAGNAIQYTNAGNSTPSYESRKKTGNAHTVRQIATSKRTAGLRIRVRDQPLPASQRSAVIAVKSATRKKIAGPKIPSRGPFISRPFRSFAAIVERWDI